MWVHTKVCSVIKRLTMCFHMCCFFSGQAGGPVTCLTPRASFCLMDDDTERERWWQREPGRNREVNFMFEHFSHPLPPLPPLQTALVEVKGYHGACWRYINPLTEVCDSVCVCACGCLCVCVCPLTSQESCPPKPCPPNGGQQAWITQYKTSEHPCSHSGPLAYSPSLSFCNVQFCFPGTETMPAACNDTQTHTFLVIYFGW